MHLFCVLVNKEYGMGAGDGSVAVFSSCSVDGMESAMLLAFWTCPMLKVGLTLHFAPKSSIMCDHVI